jgi:Cys-rich protein (TIGR01571 family)
MTYVPVSQSKSEGVELNGEVINATIVNNNHVVSEQAVVQDNGLKNWKHSLFDLFGDCGKCLKACCCAPCLLPQIAARARYYPCCCGYIGFMLLTFILYAFYYVGKIATLFAQVHHLRCMTALRLIGGLHAAGSVAALLLIYIMIRVRGHIRRKYQIYGDDCNDAVTTVCCAPCSMMQMAREVETEACCIQCNEGEEYEPKGEVVVAMIV